MRVSPEAPEARPATPAAATLTNITDDTATNAPCTRPGSPPLPATSTEDLFIKAHLQSNRPVFSPPPPSRCWNESHRYRLSLTAGNVTTDANLTGMVTRSATTLAGLLHLPPTSRPRSRMRRVVARRSSPPVRPSSPPILGTPTSVTLTNGTGLPISTGVSGRRHGGRHRPCRQRRLGRSVVTFNGALGTPSSGTLTNATDFP